MLDLHCRKEIHLQQKMQNTCTHRQILSSNYFCKVPVSILKHFRQNFVRNPTLEPHPLTRLYNEQNRMLEHGELSQHCEEVFRDIKSAEAIPRKRNNKAVWLSTVVWPQGWQNYGFKTSCCVAHKYSCHHDHFWWTSAPILFLKSLLLP